MREAQVAALKNGSKVKTVQGSSLTIKTSPAVMVDNARVTMTDIILEGFLRSQGIEAAHMVAAWLGVAEGPDGAAQAPTSVTASRPLIRVPSGRARTWSGWWWTSM